MLPLVLALAVGAPPEPPQFAVAGVGDAVPVGRVTAISLSLGAIVATPNGEKTVQGLVALRKPDTAIPAFPTGAQLITAGGDRVPGRVRGGEAKSLRFVHATSDDEWAVALDTIAAIWLTPQPNDTPTDPAKYTWLAGTPTRDALLFRNGDSTRGTITAFTDTGVKFTPDGGTARDVPLKDLAAIGFNPRFAKARKPKAAYAHLVLTDGTRFDATELAVKDNTLVCKAVCGPAVSVPLAKIVSLDVLQGAATYLSDLKPKKVESVGFLGDGWTLATDRNVRGEQLRLNTKAGESTFAKGLGTHPKMTITYDLAGKYTRFEAVVGLDAATGKRGRADVRIRVDGKELALPDLQKLTTGNAIPVVADIRGAKELTLLIDFGPTGDVQADVNWGLARLIAE